jgi:hypothetical protein
MSWKPIPHQPLQPAIGEMKELLNIPRTFQIPPQNKPPPSTECSGRTSRLVDELKNFSLTWTNKSKHWKTRRISMDELWQSIPSKKISRSGSGKSMKPYSPAIQTTRAKLKLSQHLGLPSSQKMKSLAEQLSIPPLSTPRDPVTPAGNLPQLEQGSALEPQLPLLKWLQPLFLSQRLTSPS